MRNVLFAFKRKIKSVVKIDLCTIRKLTGTNDISNLGKINRIEQTYFFPTNIYYTERDFSCPRIGDYNS